MTNEKIVRNFEAAMKALPPTANISARLKTFDKELRDTKPSFIDLEFLAGTEPKLALDGKNLERIELSASYRLGKVNYDTDIIFTFDGGVTITKSFAPEGETAAKKCTNRIYPTTKELAFMLSASADKDTVFLQDWLEDMITTIHEAGNLNGTIKLPGSETIRYNHAEDIRLVPSEWAKRVASKIVRSHSGQAGFEAIFERENGARSDFVDRITIRIKNNRKIFAEYRTYEKEGFYPASIGQHVIGSGRESIDMALVSELFPEGFPDRSPKDFLVRYVNYSEGTCELHPWPNRQKHKAG